MTTSGVYAISKTANQLVGSILRWIGVLQESQSASPEQCQDVIEAINFWLLQYSGPNSVARPGNIIWQRETASLNLDYGQGAYDLKPSGGDLNIQIPLEIFSAAIRDTDGIDSAMAQITRSEYEMIADKGAYGTPIKYCYERRPDAGKLYLDCLPDTTAAGYTMRIIYRQPLELITDGSQTLDIEGYWYRALKFNVALDVASEFGVIPDQTHYDRAKEALALINTFAPEDIGTMFFEPDREDY